MTTHFRFATAIAMLPLVLLPLALAVGGAAAPALTSSELIERMEQVGRRQRDNLENWTSTRTYRARNDRLNKWATVKIRLDYAAPGKKTYSVLEKSGSGLIARRVIYPIIEAECQNAVPKARALSDINRSNYDFQLIGFAADQQAYIFQVTPRVRNRFQFRGTIWVDSKTFGIRQVKGSPAVNPSFWVKSTEFSHEYRQFDGFWLPVRHHSEAQLRLFGTSTLDISYDDYRLSGKSLVSTVSETAIAPSQTR